MSDKTKRRKSAKLADMGKKPGKRAGARTRPTAPAADFSADNKPPAPGRAANWVVSVLEKRIYTGQIKSGGVLPAERELSEEFCVSRTVAREAVKILDGKGLICVRPRHRPVVLQPNYEMVAGVLGNLVHYLIAQPKGIEHLFGLRVFVEASLVRLAATSATRDDIANLRAALEHNGDCIADSEQFYETDVAFHAVFYEVPRNPLFPALHRAFVQWLAGHWKQMPRLPARNRRNFDAHHAIFTAILYRNPDEAEAALRQHLDDAWEQVRQTFALPPA